MIETTFPTKITAMAVVNGGCDWRLAGVIQWWRSKMKMMNQSEEAGNGKEGGRGF
ncbi:uncharacterized protein G2W53_018342 [Senna tora]|uniref:Uncharacterized protein n=1 Tax=Senna tora TaxID=362788 RepID=A0A834WN91_9FABA|nr:uncharacterized protein G2W53_018342 [Senna tora]